MDYSKATEAIAGTIAKVSKPLTESQKMVMAGAIAVWMDKARNEGFDHTSNMQKMNHRNGR